MKFLRFLFSYIFLYFVSFALNAQDFPISPFGNWALDSQEQPVFNYTMNQHQDSRAIYSTSEGKKKDHFHVIGNGKIIAFAYNHGGVQIYSGERGSLWLNKPDSKTNRFSGGYGFIKENNNIYPLLYQKNQNSKDFERQFGIGYFKKSLNLKELKVTQKIYAPNNNSSTLISEVTVKNLSSNDKKVTWNEYWDVNPEYFGDKIPSKKQSNEINNFIYSSYFKNNTLIAEIVAENPPAKKEQRSRINYYLPKFFITPLDDSIKINSFETKRALAFNKNGEFTGNFSNQLVSNVPLKNADSCFIIGQEIEVPANSEVTLRFMVGYTFEDNVQNEISKAKNNYNKDWSNLGKIDIKNNTSLKYEMLWHAYYLKALSNYDDYFKSRMISQGGWYQYGAGSQMAARDPLQHILPLIYLDPALAKDVLRYTLKEMNPDDREGYIKYGVQGVGWLQDWDNPFVSDFMLYLINAVTEYVNATRDYSFLSEILPYYPIENGKKGSVKEHLQYAWKHQINQVGIGEHGLIKLRDSDWDDILHQFNCGENIDCTNRSESTLNTALATYVFPKFAALLRQQGDTEWAEVIEKQNTLLRTALKNQWSGKWFSRAIINKNKSNKKIGENELHLGPQSWAILANVLKDNEEKNLINTLYNELTGPLGAKNINNGKQGGGVWFSFKAPLIEAYAKHNISYAWQEFISTTLFQHTKVYPNTWIGTWSGPDAYSVTFWDAMGESWSIPFNLQGYGYMMDFPAAVAHSHAIPWQGLITMMGIQATEKGYTIDPKLPTNVFSFKSELMELFYSDYKTTLNFYPKEEGNIEWRIKRTQAPKELLVNGKSHSWTMESGFIAFNTYMSKNNKITIIF